MKPDPEKRGLMNHTMTRTRSRAVRAAGVLLCVFALAGCSTIKGWFDGKDKDKSAEPSELTELTPTATVSKLWSAKAGRSEEHTSELQSLMRNSYAVFCLKKKKNN